jgi:hypothetical protein
VSVLAEAAAEMTQLMRPGAAHFHLPYDYELVRLVPHKIPKLDGENQFLVSQTRNNLLRISYPSTDIQGCLFFFFCYIHSPHSVNGSF